MVKLIAKLMVKLMVKVMVKLMVNLVVNLMVNLMVQLIVKWIVKLVVFHRRAKVGSMVDIDMANNPGGVNAAAAFAAAEEFAVTYNDESGAASESAIAAFDNAAFTTTDFAFALLSKSIAGGASDAADTCANCKSKASNAKIFFTCKCKVVQYCGKTYIPALSSQTTTVHCRLPPDPAMTMLN